MKTREIKPTVIHEATPELLQMLEAQQILRRMLGLENQPAIMTNGSKVYFITDPNPVNLQYKHGTLINDTREHAVIEAHDGTIHHVSPFSVILSH